MEGWKVSDSLQPHGLNSPWSSPGQNTWVGSLFLLQGIFLTQGSNTGLLHRKWILYQLSHKGSWWKGKFALFWMPATRVGKGGRGEGGEGGLGKKSIQRMTLLHCQSMGKNFYRQREGVRAETIQSALTVFLKLVILKDGWSDHHLDWPASSFREGNGNPLCYSCLENPMDGGAW